MKILILPDNLEIKNPCEKCQNNLPDGRCKVGFCSLPLKYRGQQSILSQAKEVDLDEMLKKYEEYKRNLGGNCVGGYEIPIPFTQFIQQQMEGKDGKDD